MAGTPTRAISFTYNGQTHSPAGPFRYEVTGTTYFFSCEFVVSGTTVANAQSAWSTAEANLNEWDKDLTVTQNGATVVSHSHANNTGMLARPVCIKAGSPEDSPLARRYSFTVRGVLPGTATDKSGGLVDYTERVNWDAARRRTVAFSFTYTAAGNNSATTNYADGSTGAKALAASALTTLGGNYELVSESRPVEDQNKQIISAGLLYRERLIPETSGGGADADFIIEELSISQRYDEESYLNGGVGVVLNVNFTVACDVEQSSNNYDDLRGVYEGQFKPIVLQHLADVFSSQNQGTGPTLDGRFIILSDPVSIQTASNRITGSMRVLAPTSSRVQRLRWSLRYFLNDHEHDREILDGQDFTFSTWRLGRRLTVVETISAMTIDQPYDVGDLIEPRTISGGPGAMIAAAQNASEGVWRRSSVELLADVVWLGHFNGTIIQRYVRTWHVSWRWQSVSSIAPAPVITPG